MPYDHRTGLENDVKNIHHMLGMALITVREGIRLGTLEGVAIDTTDGRVRYLYFKGADARADGVVPWEAVRAVGDDAITVDALDTALATIPASDQEHLTCFVGDRPVVTEAGTRLGHVTTYDLDEVTGRIERYHVATGGFFGQLMNRELCFSRAAVRALGQDAIIVDQEAALTPEAGIE